MDKKALREKVPAGPRRAKSRGNVIGSKYDRMREPAVGEKVRHTSGRELEVIFVCPNHQDAFRFQCCTHGGDRRANAWFRRRDLELIEEDA